MGRRTSCLWLLASFLLASTASADPLAYVRTTSQLDRQTDPKTNHPLNLLDNDPATVWCEGNEGLGEGEEIRFFFKKPQRIDRLVVVPAVNTGRIIHSIQLTDGVNTTELELGEQYVTQSFRPPMRGTTYVLTIDKVGGPNKNSTRGKDIACIADVLLYKRKKPFGGKPTSKRLRYHTMRDKVLGRWSGEPLGASEKFLVFALDGTWEWKFVPLMGGKKRRVTGEYRFRGNRLLMRKGETGRWADMRFKNVRVEVDPDDIGAPTGDYNTIWLNTAMGNPVSGEYNNAEF